MAKGIRALLDTVMQALPQVGNLGLLFFLLFFIFAALGVELFGRLGTLVQKFYLPQNLSAKFCPLHRVQ
jgi:Ion transport protein